MQPALDNVFRFACTNGEIITINATAGPNTNVTFAIDSAPALTQNQISIPMNKQGSGGAHFVVVFVQFGTLDGGFCQLVVSGSAGSTSEHRIDQGKKKVAGRLYQFDVI